MSAYGRAERDAASLSIATVRRVKLALRNEIGRATAECDVMHTQIGVVDGGVRFRRLVGKPTVSGRRSA